MSERKAPTGFIGNVRGRDQMDKGWETPPELLEPVRQYWGGRIPFDVCSTPANPTRALGFWTPEDDALHRPWPERCWTNPPYGRDMRAWVEKAVTEAERGSEIILLLSAARWEQGWWQTFIASAKYVCFIRGRVAFIRPATGERVGGNTYANMYAGLGLHEPRRWARCLKDVGLCMLWRALGEPPARTAYQLWRELKDEALMQGELFGQPARIEGGAKP